MKNDATGMTPSDAKKQENIFQVKSSLEMHRVKKRKYPDIHVGDDVRIYTKKKQFDKERVTVWSDYKYKVDRIEESNGQNFYHVEGVDRPYLRHELLLQR